MSIAELLAPLKEEITEMVLSKAAIKVKNRLWYGFHALSELNQIVEAPLSAIDELEAVGFKITRRPLYVKNSTEHHLFVTYGFESIEEAQQVDVLLDTA